MYTSESLDTLRQRIDLIEVLSSHLSLKRSGSTFKALCPFHEEKSPSFMVKRGDSHYHCFGCGAHGDAIAFLMQQAQMGFIDAVEYLADRFQVHLERVDRTPTTGPSRSHLKETLESACQFYHFFLLHTEEGHEALTYLYNRGIDLAFIRHFQIGSAPREKNALLQYLKELGLEEAAIEQAGLMRSSERGRSDFFHERIMFPIRDSVGSVIGFSGRKFKENTPGGKYVNTAETPLFKKSLVLFGLSYCRKRIAKERRVIIVEGQIDALRLIHLGVSITVAGQGTAFGSGHVEELLRLGVKEAYLALDADKAGQEASCKIGDMFQKKGVSVRVIRLAEGKDPDTLLKEEGAHEFLQRMERALDYLTFLVGYRSQTIDLKEPAIKSQLAEEIALKIRCWEHPVMVHESLRQLAALLSIPEETLGNSLSVIRHTIKKHSSAKLLGFDIDIHRILEIDILRWVLMSGEQQPVILGLMQLNDVSKKMKVSFCKQLLEACLEAHEKNMPCDFLNLASWVDEKEGPTLIAQIVEKKINLQKAVEGCRATLLSLLQREWLEETEAIKVKIQSGSCSDEEALELARRFAEIKKNPPQLKVHK